MDRIKLSMDRFKKKPEKVLSEGGELIGMFLEKLNEDRKPPYKPLKAARVGMMLSHLTTPNLRAFYRECESAGHFSKFYWWKFKVAKESKNVINSH